MAELLNPEDVVITSKDGVTRTYVIHTLPYPEGRKVAALYPVANMPKVGDYKVSEEVMQVLFKFVAVRNEETGVEQRLTTMALIANHVPDAMTGLQLEVRMLAKNFDFFGKGGLFASLSRFLEQRLPSIIQTLIPLLPPSLVADVAAGLNSAKKSD
jgi:hypothetical protein